MVVTCFLTDGEKARHEAAKFFCSFCKKVLSGDASGAAMRIVGHKLGGQPSTRPSASLMPVPNRIRVLTSGPCVCWLFIFKVTVSPFLK